MLISIAKSNRYLSVSDIVTYICEFDQFDKYFEIIDERISNTMLSLTDKNCKIAALEFTLSIMTITSNIHSNLFMEHLLSNQFHKVLFKYLKHEIKEIQSKYHEINDKSNNDNNSNNAELVINNNQDENKQNDNDESKQENKNEDEQAHFKEEQYTLSQLEGNQQLLMLILSNIVILSHYQRFESDNAALKYIAAMKVQPVSV